jgi:dephospho-CoA kinase
VAPGVVWRGSGGVLAHGISLDGAVDKLGGLWHKGGVVGYFLGQVVVHRKPIIGLCGGVGAGKSRVAAEFERLGCLVVDSDKLNHEVLLQPAVLRTLQSWWGQEVVAPDGTPNRRRIADIIFADAVQKERLEGLLHPLILRRQEAMIRAVEDNPAIKAIVIDSPLLLESQLDRQCDTIVFVKADETRRLERLRRERGWTAEEVKRREGWQIPLVEKRSRAAFVVDNDGPVERLCPQVADILQTILAQHS